MRSPETGVADQGRHRLRGQGQAREPLVHEGALRPAARLRGQGQRARRQVAERRAADPERARRGPPTSRSAPATRRSAWPRTPSQELNVVFATWANDSRARGVEPGRRGTRADLRLLDFDVWIDHDDGTSVPEADHTWSSPPKARGHRPEDAHAPHLHRRLVGPAKPPYNRAAAVVYFTGGAVPGCVGLDRRHRPGHLRRPPADDRQRHPEACRRGRQQLRPAAGRAVGRDQGRAGQARLLRRHAQPVPARLQERAGAQEEGRGGLGRHQCERRGRTTRPCGTSGTTATGPSPASSSATRAHSASSTSRPRSRPASWRASHGRSRPCGRRRPRPSSRSRRGWPRVGAVRASEASGPRALSGPATSSRPLLPAALRHHRRAGQ